VIARREQASLHDVAERVISCPERKGRLRAQGLLIQHVVATLRMDVNETEGWRRLVDDQP
jgi:hypothetical protein